MHLNQIVQMLSAVDLSLTWIFQPKLQKTQHSQDPAVQLTSQSFIVLCLYLYISHFSSQNWIFIKQDFWEMAFSRRVLTPAPACWVTSCPYPIQLLHPFELHSLPSSYKTKMILIVLLIPRDSHVRTPRTVPGTSFPLAFTRTFTHYQKVLAGEKGDFSPFSHWFIWGFYASLFCVSSRWVQSPKRLQGLGTNTFRQNECLVSRADLGTLPGLCPRSRIGPSAVTFRSFSWGVGTNWECVSACNVLCAAFCSSWPLPGPG